MRPHTRIIKVILYINGIMHEVQDAVFNVQNSAVLVLYITSRLFVSISTLTLNQSCEFN